jgi:hypothetical protein
MLCHFQHIKTTCTAFGVLYALQSVGTQGLYSGTFHQPFFEVSILAETSGAVSLPELGLGHFLIILACILGAIFLVLHAGSLSAVEQEPQSLLSGSLYWWPMLAFVMTFFCGHLLSNKLFWFDRLCSDQENLLRRCQALKAVPAFVAHSERMIILLDETYFSGFGAYMSLLALVWQKFCSWS